MSPTPIVLISGDRIIELFVSLRRLILAPIIVEGEEQRNAIGTLLRLSVSIPRADFKEVLSDVTVPLMEFYRAEVIIAQFLGLHATTDHFLISRFNSF